ncbi:MAG TPA: efflux RND transporter periplasmic adaptor subunit [Opitutales bacterium]|nr:efflux RND transporter periplasmic adaptor subunit [Opitutales bacterium]
MSSESKTEADKKGRKLQWSLLAAVCAVLLVGTSVAWIRFGAEPVDYGLFVEATRRDLTVSVTESGTLRSRDQVVVSNRIEGRTTLLWIIPEGTMVEEGDLLAEFDASQLENKHVQSRIQVQNAEATFIRAREQLEVTKSQNESDIAEAELTLRLAKLDLARYLGRQEMLEELGFASLAEEEAPLEEAAITSEADGEYAQQREELVSEINLRKQELARAEQQYQDSKDLAAQGFITELEVEGDRLSMERAQVQLKVAEGQLRLLESYTHKRDLEQLQSDVVQAERALDRVELIANANLVQAQADFDSAQQHLEVERRELANIELQLSHTKLRAPAAGMVVYETSANQSRWGNNEPLEAGQEIRERQELIYLPSSEGMVADINVHESSLERIFVGMPARITVDARPGTELVGKVRKIAPMPDAQSIWLNPDLTVYSTEVEVESTSQNLRTGMSCRVEVIIEELIDVVTVPLQSVVRFGRNHYVYVLPEQGPPVARRVTIGLDNNRLVHIIEGLDAGELVMMSPPLHDRLTDEEFLSEEPPPADPVDESAVDESLASTENGEALGGE